MKIAILGSGAMGTVLGAYLTRNGCAVEMVDTYQAHVDALNRDGAHIVGTVDSQFPSRLSARNRWRGSTIWCFCLQNSWPTTPCCRRY